MVKPGFGVDDFDGNHVGTVHSLYLDADGGVAVWLVAKLGRRRTKLVAVPLRNCAGGGGRVWVAHERQALHSAPAVDPTRPLLREHELAICAHYGIGERAGRAAEVAGRPEGAVTSRPA
jgi:PRC-barrel domain protein